MMKLADMTVTGFADTVASDAPAPGGGSCAALYGSIGAALTAMVGGLTQGRKKYAEYAEHAAEVEKKGNELKTRLLDVMDRDTEAFNVVSAAFGMPKDDRRGEGCPLRRHPGGPEGLHQDARWR